MVAGFRAFRQPPDPSEPIEAVLFRKWLQGEWTWVASEELLDEYREILLTAERGLIASIDSLNW